MGRFRGRKRKVEVMQLYYNLKKRNNFKKENGSTDQPGPQCDTLSPQTTKQK